MHIKEQALKDDGTAVESYSPRDVIVDEPNDDDINDALNNLQMSLEGKSNETKATEVTQYPELKDYHMFLKYITLTTTTFKMVQKQTLVWNEKFA